MTLTTPLVDNNSMLKRIGTVATVCLLAIFTATPVTVLAQVASPTSDQLQAISTNCNNIKLSLNQLDRTDTVARINRGRDYDQVLAQIVAFDNRLAHNKVDTSEFTQVATVLQASIDQFRSDYNTYENQLSTTAADDCKNKPLDFYGDLVKTRDNRSAVAAQVITVANVMADYRNVVSKYQTTLQGAAQ